MSIARKRILNLNIKIWYLKLTASVFSRFHIFALLFYISLLFTFHSYFSCHVSPNSKMACIIELIRKVLPDNHGWNLNRLRTRGLISFTTIKLFDFLRYEWLILTTGHFTWEMSAFCSLAIAENQFIKLCADASFVIRKRIIAV